MPTWATVAKGATEALILITVFVPFVKWMVEKILAQHKETMTSLMLEMKDDRLGHAEEVDKVLGKYDSIREVQIEARAESTQQHERTRDHIDGVGERLLLAAKGVRVKS